MPSKKRHLWSLLAVSLANATPAAALPKLGQGDSAVFGDPADAAARLFQDASDPELYYVAPKRVVPVADAMTGRKLFSLSLNATTGTGELQGIFRLGFDPELTSRSWMGIRAAQPNAVIKQVPILNGEFGIEMRQQGFALLIGKGEVVATDTGIDFPVQIELNSNGIFLLQAQAAQGNLAALTLTFNYGATYQVDGAVYQFTANLRGLIMELAADPSYATEWQQSAELTEFSLKRFLLASYSKGLWQSANAQDAEFDLNIASYLFYMAVDEKLQELAGPNFGLRHKAILGLDLNVLPQGFSDLKRTSSDEQVVLRDSAAMSLRGICGNYADVVYEEVSGESRCLTVLGQSQPQPSGGSSTDGGGVYVPDF